MNTAIGYIRVSTSAQADDGVSLEIQTKKIRDYCSLHDINLCGIYGDDISGKAIDNRPGLQAVLMIAEARKVGHVVVWKKDRLARKCIDTLQVAEKFDRWGVALHSITDHVDTKSAIGRFFFTMQAAMAEFEREQIQERVKAAMSHLKANGKKTGREAPYGYRWENGQAVEDEDEQVCLCLLQRLHEENPKWGLRRLSRELEAAKCVNRNGKPFHPESIKGMLEA